MVSLLGWYAIVPIIMLLAALETLACVVLKTTENIAHYRVSQRFFVVFNLTTMALPGSLVNQSSENKEWIRWESRLSFLVHSAFHLALTLIWENTYQLKMGLCAHDFIKKYMPFILIGIVFLAAMHVTATEIYLRCLPDLSWLGITEENEYDETIYEGYRQIQIKTLATSENNQILNSSSHNNTCHPREVSCLMNTPDYKNKNIDAEMLETNITITQDGIEGTFTNESSDMIERKKSSLHYNYYAYHPNEEHIMCMKCEDDILSTKSKDEKKAQKDLRVDR